MQFLKNVTNQNEIIFSSSSKAEGQCFFKKKMRHNSRKFNCGTKTL